METTINNAPEPSLPGRVSISGDVIFQYLNNECVLLNMTTEIYYGLDSVGSHMWQLLAEDGDTARTLSELRAHYDADEDTLRLGLASLIQQLKTEGLISV